jgi:hypothetical protein
MYAVELAQEIIDEKIKVEDDVLSVVRIIQKE